MSNNSYAPMIVTTPNRGVKDDQDGMFFLNWSRMSLADLPVSKFKFVLLNI